MDKHLMWCLLYRHEGDWHGIELPFPESEDEAGVLRRVASIRESLKLDGLLVNEVAATTARPMSDREGTCEICHDWTAELHYISEEIATKDGSTPGVRVAFCSEACRAGAFARMSKLIAAAEAAGERP